MWLPISIGCEAKLQSDLQDETIKLASSLYTILFRAGASRFEPFRLMAVSLLVYSVHIIQLPLSSHPLDFQFRFRVLVRVDPNLCSPVIQ